MSLFTREETRSLTYGDVWGTGSDPLIGTETVTRIAPVYSAVSLIADLFVQGNARAVSERADGELDPAPTPMWLKDPDPFLSPSTWRYQFVVSCKLRGNAYGLVDPGRRFVRWLHPDWVQIDESTPLQPRYFVLGQEVDLVKRGGSLIHVPEFVQPGRVKGISPIQQFMDLFDGAAAAAAYGRSWFKNASIPPAILSTKAERVGAEVLREARDDFVAAAKTGLPVALPGEWNWQRISVAPAEAQFLETIKANATTIASIFRVPAEDIGGEAGSSRTYSNREMDQELLNVRTMQPLGTRFGDGVAPLLPTGQKVIVDFDGLAQPGVLESSRADSEQLKNGTLTLAEARRSRGRRPLTAQEIADWQQWYATFKSESESEATSVSVTKEQKP
jgi:HK97 family phage portal protein